MLNTKEVKIGCDIYNIVDDAEMFGSELGSIEETTSTIRMRVRNYNNRKISDRMYFKVLMHEIVHGIDFNTMFVGENKTENLSGAEDTIDLVSIYIVENLCDIVENKEDQFDHFMSYMSMCETESKRLVLLFNAILNLFDDNKGLIKEFISVFK